MTATDFDARAATWDDDPTKVERAQAVADEIVARVPLTRAMRALEYGCGTGLLSFILRARLGDITLADVSDGGLSAEASFSNNSKATYTYGTAMAHVAVDAKTGHVEILDYVVVDDVGRIINPHTLHGQVVGAAVQGLGSVFSEDLVYDANGQLLSGTLADYLIPVATDYPNVRATSLELHPSPNNPLGAKGAGEGGIIPVGGALANAVSNALVSLGIEIRQLPLTPPRLWSLINGHPAANLHNF